VKSGPFNSVSKAIIKMLNFFNDEKIIFKHIMILE